MTKIPACFDSGFPVSSFRAQSRNLHCTAVIRRSAPKKTDVLFLRFSAFSYSSFIVLL